MKKYAGFALVFLVVGGLSAFIVSTIASVNRGSPPAEPPDPLTAPVRVYGWVEPEGGEVRLSLPGGRKLITAHVREGDRIRRGQKLCTFDNSVEEAQLNVALARLAGSRKTAEISLDELNRKKKLFDASAISEFDYLTVLGKKEIDEINVEVADREVELASAQLDRLTITSPLDGVVYRFDLRIGESYSDGDDTRILLGSRGLQVRLFVEVFWIGRLKPEDSYAVFNSETGEQVGTGTIISQSLALGPKTIQSEDPQERQDTSFQEVLLSLQTSRAHVPIGLTVVVRQQD
jgi:multidrug efflux pump subunit AcrA (membrane-fusion protein)